MREGRAPLDRDSGRWEIAFGLSRAGAGTEAHPGGRTAALTRAPAMPAAWRRTGLALAPLAVAAMLTHAGPALGHASLIGSEPADRAVVARSPATLTLTFNEPVTPAVLRLVGAGGHTTVLTDVSAENARLIVRLPQALPQGTHILSWRVFSADGHPVGGALTFSVGEPSTAPSGPQLESEPTLRAAIWLARLMLYVGLLIGVGGTVYAGWIAREPGSPAVRRVLVTA